MKEVKIMALKELVNKVNGNSVLCEGRTKALIRDVIGEPLTWVDVDAVPMKQDGVTKEVPVVIFKEYPKNFFFGGDCFAKIVSEMTDDDYKDLRTNGLKIQLDQKPQKNNPSRTYTALSLYHEPELPVANTKKRK